MTAKPMTQFESIERVHELERALEDAHSRLHAREQEALKLHETITELRHDLRCAEEAGNVELYELISVVADVRRGVLELDELYERAGLR